MQRPAADGKSYYGAARQPLLTRVALETAEPRWEMCISCICSKSKYTVYLVYLVAGGSNTRPQCILCICFKVKYTVYLVYLQVCICVFPI